ncbi:MAG: hypothetical protein R6V47_05890, partial [Candidatus Delongbacteria bacterium]
MRERLYGILSGLIIKHNGKVILFAAAVTLIQLYLATGIGIKNQLADMMPDDVAQVESFTKIVDDFTSDAQIMITVKSAEKNEEKMIEAAEYITGELSVIEHVQPSEDQDLSLVQRLKIFFGKTG